MLALVILFLSCLTGCDGDGGDDGELDAGGPAECCVFCLESQKACGDGCIPQELTCNVTDCGCACDHGESRPSCD